MMPLTTTAAPRRPATETTMRQAFRVLLAGSLALPALAGCADDPVRPPILPPGGAAPRGVVQVTFSGLGGPNVTSAAQMLSPTGGASAVLLVPSNTDGSLGGGGIQLVPSFTAEFTQGDRGAGGQRYALATFVVRNAAADGTPYDTPRRNLTFLAVSRSTGIEGTAVLEMNRFGGTAARAAIARQIRPTGAAALNADGQVHANGTDVLQAFSEEDVASVARPEGVTSVLPYGFMARTASGSRVIPVGGEGLVTFAFRIPLQGTAAADPYTITFSFLVVEDSETRLTQSVQEQDPAGEVAFAQRAAALNPALVTLLPGSGYFDVARPSRTLCAVRTAGTPEAPAAYLFTPVPDVVALTPDPYAPYGGVVARNGSIAATFSGPVSKPTAQNFAVNGSQRGRRFLGAAYSGGGNTTGAATPAGNYFPGEEVEATITTALACGGRVARLRAAADAGSGRFQGGTLPSSGGATDVAVGDLDGDGVLDVVEARFNVDSVAVRLGNGGGAFRGAARYRVFDGPRGVALADMNADGWLDVVTTNLNSGNAAVLLNNGAGGLAPAVYVPTAAQSQSLALGDVNVDGVPDLVTASQANGTIAVLINRGGTTFQRATYSVPSASDLALYDVNSDGMLDIVATQFLGSSVAVLPRLPRGGFGAAVTSPAGSQPVSLAVGDVTGDGKPDVVVGNATSANVALMAGTGTGGFGSPQVLTAATYPVAVVLGDVNGDGRLDLVAVDRDQNNARVLLNNGGAFGAPALVALGTSPRAAALADANGNGRLDLVAVNAGSNTLSLLFDAP